MQATIIYVPQFLVDFGIIKVFTYLLTYYHTITGLQFIC